jgi:hypothetical protein
MFGYRLQCDLCFAVGKRAFALHVRLLAARMDAIYPAVMRRYCSASQDEVAEKPLHGGRTKSPRKP